MLAGTEVAHALAYRIVYPVASVRWHVLEASGHGYMGYAPLLFGIGGAVLVAGFASTIVDAARRRPARALPAWAFGLLPLVGYTIQEFVERLLATNVLPWWMFEQPTFRVGLLLQVPFALLVYLAAKLLLRAAERIGFLLRTKRPTPSHRGAATTRWVLRSVALPRLAPLVAGSSGRGPPLP
jgi:hypothetical protein